MIRASVHLTADRLLRGRSLVLRYSKWSGHRGQLSVRCVFPRHCGLLQGYDGFLYSIGFFVAWLVALLLVAERCVTPASSPWPCCPFRLRQRPVRVAASISTLAVTFFYLLAQMAGTGALVSLLLGIGSRPVSPRDRRRGNHHDRLPLSWAE